jgi:glucose-6-phosphate isomerase
MIYEEFPKFRKDLRALYEDVKKAKVNGNIELILALVIHNAKIGLTNYSNHTILPMHEGMREYIEYCGDIADALRKKLPDSTITLHENFLNIQISIDWS